ncbi:hypothetical protein PNEG_02048 [Pneumocystis murina B123]|uniref:TLC domain-containing protein n=1 Tax=Pneumocystis murina (strain B123) TaxID=1069680 RepID=M7NRH1_PNEMU|nr:hypothetical protein PNEG_02048 [Pneumocystis murina B123]EMR09867.1 hypothetical protein PNEG_02048 [Pneumocystis murina B123]
MKESGFQEPCIKSFEGYLKIYLRFIKKHTWIGSLLLLVSSYVLYFLRGKGSSDFLYPFLFLSYPTSDTFPQQYGKGYKDLCFLAFHVVTFIFLRDFLMHVLIKPIGQRINIKKRKLKRFMEQGYSLCYFSMSSVLGIYIMFQNRIWYFNVDAFYDGYPHKTHDIYFKGYYLLQFSYWIQQTFVLVLKLEKPRKDFREFVIHHIITLILIGLSYRFHFTYLGLSVFITMDTSDIFLSLSKLMNYIQCKGQALVFGFFILLWIYGRHYLNIVFLYSIFTSFKHIGPYELSWEKGHYKCWISQVIIFILLLALQIVNILWLVLILRIAYRFVVHGEAKDDRSDDEDEKSLTKEKEE